MTPLAREIDGPVAVIGDVHGQINKLVDILDQLRGEPDYQRRWVVFIGDLVDRGPDPKGAIDLFLELREEHPRTTAVAGNHEFAMAASLGYFPPADSDDWAERWCDHYGAGTTFDSYDVAVDDVEGLKAAVPDNHREFLTELPWAVEHPHLLFVHAGLDPHLPFPMQMAMLNEPDYTRVRPPWLCSKSFVESRVPDDCPLTVVSGHVPMPAVQFGDRRILVDTTGGEQGDLSCVLLPEEIVITSGDDPPPPPIRAHPSRKKKRLFGLLR